MGGLWFSAFVIARGVYVSLSYIPPADFQFYHGSKSRLLNHLGFVAIDSLHHSLGFGFGRLSPAGLNLMVTPSAVVTSAI